MITDDKELAPGMVVRHDEGLLYKVEDTRTSTIDYELAHRLGGTVVNYIQLQDGSFPLGTKWSKDEAGFREYFTIETQQRTISQMDFRKLLHSIQGGTVSWRGLMAIADKNADFPLQNVGEDPHELTGDIAAAIEWLKPGIQESAPPSYYTTLQSIHDGVLDEEK